MILLVEPDGLEKICPAAVALGSVEIPIFEIVLRSPLRGP